MVKYLLLKARRSGTLFLWSRATAALLTLVKQVDEWADEQRKSAMYALHEEHKRVGEARLLRATDAQLQADVDAAAEIKKAKAHAAALRKQADAVVADAQAFLHDTRL